VDKLAQFQSDAATCSGAAAAGAPAFAISGEGLRGGFRQGCERCCGDTPAAGGLLRAYQPQECRAGRDSVHGGAGSNSSVSDEPRAEPDAGGSCHSEACASTL